MDIAVRGYNLAKRRSQFSISSTSSGYIRGGRARTRSSWNGTAASEDQLWHGISCTVHWASLRQSVERNRRQGHRMADIIGLVLRHDGRGTIDGSATSLGQYCAIKPALASRLSRSSCRSVEQKTLHGLVDEREKTFCV